MTYISNPVLTVKEKYFTIDDMMAHFDRPLNIGLAYNIHEPWFQHTLRGISRFAEKRDWLFHTPPQYGRDHQPIRQELDGLLFSYDVWDEHLPDVDIPSVCLGWFPPIETRHPRVAGDLWAMGRMAADYLYERGYRTLVAGEPYGNSFPGRARLSAFLWRARALGCRVTSVAQGLHQAGLRSEEDEHAVAAVGEFLQSLPKPIGMLTADSRSTWRMLHVCRMVGLTLPDDVALISGGEDEELLEVLRPTVSAIIQDTEAMGYQAAARLDELLQGQPVPPTTLIQPLGVASRQSTERYAFEDQSLVRALELIWEKVDEGVSVADLAEQLGISERTLVRKFERAMNTTPWQMIRHARIETAKRLLRTTDRPLVQVAFDSGLGSQSLLTRYIKEATGLTPMQFRQKR
jgi:LacI family transcriptional regulator